MKLCEWCQEKPVKLKKNKTCSVQCGASLRWEEMRQKGLTNYVLKGMEVGKRSIQYKKLTKEIERACKELNITVTPTVRKLYVRARNRGYNNGYSCAINRNQRPPIVKS